MTGKFLKGAWIEDNTPSNVEDPFNCKDMMKDINIDVINLCATIEMVNAKVDLIKDDITDNIKIESEIDETILYLKCGIVSVGVTLLVNFLFKILN